MISVLVVFVLYLPLQYRNLDWNSSPVLNPSHYIIAFVTCGAEIRTGRSEMVLGVLVQRIAALQLGLHSHIQPDRVIRSKAQGALLGTGTIQVVRHYLPIMVVVSVSMAMRSVVMRVMVVMRPGMRMIQVRMMIPGSLSNRSHKLRVVVSSNWV